MYLQSHIAPALLEVCKETFPDDTETFDKVLVKWRKANRRVIAKGEKAYPKVEGISAEEVDASVKTEVDKAVEKVRARSTEERRETCDTIVELLRRES